VFDGEEDETVFKAVVGEEELLDELPLVNVYRLNRFAPPQISDELPLHAILQPTLPSEAGAP
jgi:hypothetical protein